MSRLLSEGKTARLREMVTNRTFASGMIFAIGGVCFAFLGQPLLALIGSNTGILEPSEIVLYVALLLLQTNLVMSLMVSATGNEVICFKGSVIAALTSISLLLFWRSENFLEAVLISIFVPQLLILNFKPLRIAANRLGVSPVLLFVRGWLPPVVVVTSSLLIECFLAPAG